MMTSNDDHKAKLNRLMSEQRRALADLMQDLKGNETVLEQARKRYAELASVLHELGSEVEEKRRRAFALKMNLEGQRHASRARSKSGRILPEPPTGGNKRASPRLPFNLHVNFGGLRGFYSGVAVNLSEGGMLVATCDPPPVGKRFAVEFELDAHHTVRAPVEAVWVEHRTTSDETGHAVAEVGLRFVDLPPGDRQRVRAFVEAVITVIDA